MATDTDTGLAEDGVAPTAPTDVVATATADESAAAPEEPENRPKAVKSDA